MILNAIIHHNLRHKAKKVKKDSRIFLTRVPWIVMFFVLIQKIVNFARSFSFIPFVLFTGTFCIEQQDFFSRLPSSDESHLEDRFYIRFNTDYYDQGGRHPILWELSDENNIGLIDCGIERDTESVEDKYCILDVNEGDVLLANGSTEFPLKYNVPQELCEYTSFYAPWHWNQETSNGPPVVLTAEFSNDEEDGSEDGEEENEENEEEESCIFECKIPLNQLSGLSGFSIDEIRRVIFSSNTYCGILRVDVSSGQCNRIEGGNNWVRKRDDTSDCPFDKSNNGLGNCCVGQYLECALEPAADLATPTIQEINPTTVQLDNEEGCQESSYGTDVQQCIGGPLRIANWDQNTEDTNTGFNGYPIPRVIYSWDDGIHQEFNINLSGILFYGSYENEGLTGIRREGENTIHPRRFSIPIATYYDGIEDLEWTSDVDCSSLPPMFCSTHRTGYPQYLGYPYFTLECLDSNYEALHRVHLMIREWNTLEEFIEFQDSDGRRGDPDVEGDEGSDCNYYESEEFDQNPCNDAYDLDDLIENCESESNNNNNNCYPELPYDGGGGGGSGSGGGSN